LSLNRSEKQAVIEEVTALAAKAQTLVMAEYRGIAVADMTKLRVDARSKGVTLSVLKNTLARRAVAGTGFEVAVDQMTGPLIYGFSEDAVAAAKVVADFAKTNDKLVIRAGVYGGKALDPNGSFVGSVVGLDAVPHLSHRARVGCIGREKSRRRCCACQRRSCCRLSAQWIRTTNC
jgi:large subunit ribosomal protein L10